MREHKDPTLLKMGRALRRFTRETEEALLHVGELSPSEAFWLRGSIERAEATTAAIRHWVETGEKPPA